MTIPDKLISRAARAACRANNATPINIVRGNQPPIETGESFYYTTPSGKTIINSPNFYHWPKVYHASTLAVTVGRGWARRERLRIEGGFLVGKHVRVHGVRVQKQFRRRGVEYLCQRRGCDPYHVGNGRFCVGAESYRDAAKTALRQWGKQREIDKIAAVEAAERQRLYVSVDDSTRAGNCPSETERFAKRLWATIEANGPCAVRADLIIASRDDSYTRRAVSAAAQREA